MAQKTCPNLQREERLWNDGCSFVAGVDEAGRGALAGPVVAAAVIVASDSRLEGVWRLVKDSKLLSPAQREHLEPQIREEALGWSVGEASADEIDRHGIAAATRSAMQRAIEGLPERPEHLLIDWVRLPALTIAQTCWAKADRDSVSVAAASILAKVHRDRLLCELDIDYPEYGFATHKGYGTAQHRSAISHFGPCPVHRFTFAPVAQHKSLFDSAAQPTQVT